MVKRHTDLTWHSREKKWRRVYTGYRRVYCMYPTSQTGCLQCTLYELYILDFWLSTVYSRLQGILYLPCSNFAIGAVYPVCILRSIYSVLAVYSLKSLQSTCRVHCDYTSRILNLYSSSVWEANELVILWLTGDNLLYLGHESENPIRFQPEGPGGKLA